MIYILRSSIPAGINHKAAFYLGHAEDLRLQERIEEHRRGRGSKLTQWWVQQGADIELVAIFTGGRAAERYLKLKKGHSKILKAAMSGQTCWRGQLVWNREPHTVQSVLVWLHPRIDEFVK